MGDLSDSNFVKQAREGNKQAYDYLVRKYQFRIIKLVRQYVSTQETAEDIAQEAFVKAYYGLQNFREESKFYTWLYKIAINTAKNHLGKEKKRAREYSVLIEEVENSNVVAIEKDVPPCKTTIEVVACRENGVSGDNAKYVLEVTAGFVDKFSITENSKMEIISI